MSDHVTNPDDYGRHEVSEYWKRVHNLAADTFADSELLPVVADPGTPDWEKRYVAHFQRRAFLRALSRCPPVEGLSVLEFGCGTGRWTKLLAERGANVLGIDIAEDAIERNRRTIPQAEFRCQNVTESPPAKGAFDLIVSVTVLQHLPFEVQEEVVGILSEALRPGGTFLMLENIHDRARTVFSREIKDWTLLAADSGLTRIYSRGYGYDVLPRAGRRLVGLYGSQTRVRKPLARLTPQELAEATYERYARHNRRYTFVFKPLVTASYLTEPISELVLPSAWATHCAFVFKMADGDHHSTADQPEA